MCSGQENAAKALVDCGPRGSDSINGDFFSQILCFFFCFFLKVPAIFPWGGSVCTEGSCRRRVLQTADCGKQSIIDVMTGCACALYEL